jgi:hypothetical protein
LGEKRPERSLQALSSGNDQTAKKSGQQRRTSSGQNVLYGLVVSFSRGVLWSERAILTQRGLLSKDGTASGVKVSGGHMFCEP